MNDNPIRDLTEWLLHRVRQRPGMYIGVSLDESNAMQWLQTYLLGYEECHCIERGANSDRYIDQFTDWIHTKTGAPQGPLRLGPILNECRGNHMLALKKFFEYLEVFDREVPFDGRNSRVG
jgi:hypothetical protein